MFDHVFDHVYFFTIFIFEPFLFFGPFLCLDHSYFFTILVFEQVGVAQRGSMHRHRRRVVFCGVSGDGAQNHTTIDPNHGGTGPNVEN